MCRLTAYLTYTVYQIKAALGRFTFFMQSQFMINACILLFVAWASYALKLLIVDNIFNFPFLNNL
jgi:hypothetical protein